MSNEPVIDRLANWLGSAGFSIRKQPVSPAKYNLIATIGTGSEGLVLSGHTDTVPCDEALWQSDPFKLTEREGRFYGLGSCDMKSFLAMALQASRQFDFSHARHPLTLVATADEETTMAGARLLAENEKPLGKFCVIGEPTDLMPIREHKGIIMEAIKFSGQSGHSSNPALGNSALEGMHEFIQLLLNYRQQLQQQFHNEAFAVSQPTLNLGHIHGGDNPNRICGECELHIDLRFLPGMKIEELRDGIHRLALQVAAARGLEVSFNALLNGVPAMHTRSDSDINEFLQEATQRQSQSVAFGTEAPFYNQMGTDTIVIGPGSINQAHQPDEFLPANQIEPTVNLLQNLIQRYCF
jgi:acetylornithine deacetylase